MSQDEFDYLWKRRFEVLYRAELSVLYHQKRERFFELCDKLAKAVAVIGGSAALANFTGPDAVRYFAAAITVTSTLSLVFGFSDRSRRHAESARNFKQLEADIVARGEQSFTESDISAWDAKARLLETSEPPALSALVVLCQNEIAVAVSQPEKVVKMNLFERWFAYLFDFHPKAKGA